MEKTTILLADDHALLRAGLKMLLESSGEYTVVGEAENGKKALDLAKQLKPDMLLLDISMPVLDGLALLRALKKEKCACLPVVLTMHEDDEYIRQAMQEGARGYVQKSAVDLELFDALRTILSGRIYLNLKNSETLLNLLLAGDKENVEIVRRPENILSIREYEVLRLYVWGHSLKEIGEQLGLSVKTVDTYRSRIMNKLGFMQKQELIAYAIKYKILQLEE